MTAADGALAFYSTETNEHRYESPEEAILLDKRTQQVWNGHPCHIIIDNAHDSFEAKLIHMQLWIESLLGLLRETQFVQSICLSSATFSLSSLPVPSESIKTFDVKEIFLEVSVVECLLRTDVPLQQYSDWKLSILQRSCCDSVSYWLKWETNSKFILRRIPEQRFSEYLQLMNSRSQVQVTLSSEHCFVWDDVACILCRQINEDTQVRNEFEWRFSYLLHEKSLLISNFLESFRVLSEASTYF